MTEKEKEETLRQKEQDLLYYLRNYNELTKIRPNYKKVVDKEIKEIIKLMKSLSR